MVRARDAGGDAVPVDVSLGVWDPLLAVPDPETPQASRHLAAHLPRLVEDARHALERLERSGRLAADAEQDPLTGLLNRRAYQRPPGVWVWVT